MVLIYFSWAELSHKQNSSLCSQSCLFFYNCHKWGDPSKGKIRIILFTVNCWNRKAAAAHKLLALLHCFIWSSMIVPLRAGILHAMLPAILQTYFIPYHPRWCFSYSFCFYIWILDCDILVIPVPRLSCAAWAWFATCLLYQLLSFSWERAAERGSSQC